MTAIEIPPVVELVHALPGRLRLRLWWLRDHPGRARPLCEHLTALPGMDTVEVRRFTGSVLCTFDPARLDPGRILRAVAEHTGALVHLPGQASPAEEQALARAAYAEGAHLARAATSLLKGLDAEVLHFTEGRADAGSLAAITFIAAGAIEVAVTGELPVPPWFQLAWWAFRTFTTLEKRTIDATEHPLSAAVRGAPAGL